jgi:hypothetical protein
MSLSLLQSGVDAWRRDAGVLRYHHYDQNDLEERKTTDLSGWHLLILAHKSRSRIGREREQFLLSLLVGRAAGIEEDGAQETGPEGKT